jgi:hypothetical protein
MPIFVNFSGLGGDTLNDAYMKIDADFLKLSSAGPDTFVKVEADHVIKYDISVIGDSFHKLGDDFVKISDAASAIDSLFLKFAPAPATSDPTLAAAASVVGGGAPDAESDFVKLDSSLKIAGADLGVLGSDFVKLDTAPDLATFKSNEVKVGTDFGKVGADMSDIGGGFAQLGNDLITLGTGPNSNSADLNDAFKMLGGELNKIGSAFDTVAFDFNKLSKDFTTLGGGGGGVSASALVASSSSGGPAPTGALGSDFFKLEQDFILLNQTLGASGPGVFKVFDALIDQSGKEPMFEQVEHLLGGHGGSDHG